MWGPKYEIKDGTKKVEVRSQDEQFFTLNDKKCRHNLSRHFGIELQLRRVKVT